MTRLEDRQILVRDIEQACAEGARLAPACALGGIDARTLRRWKAGDGLQQGDRRPEADRPVPSHALSEAERARIIQIANEPRFAETPPARIVPALADEGIYIASESSFHRVLRAHGQMNRRGRAQPPRTSRPPTTHIASRPGDVWCWDVTFLPAQIQGRWFYFYLILDLYSRKIVGFEVHDTDSAEHAAHLARRTALAEGVHAKPERPVLHGDNGATLTHLMHRIAGIRWRAWYNYLESRRDWVLTPLSTPGQNLPCPPTPTIRFSRFRCQVSARRKSPRPSMPVRSVPTAAFCCWRVPTSASA